MRFIVAILLVIIGVLLAVAWDGRRPVASPQAGWDPPTEAPARALPPPAAPSPAPEPVPPSIRNPVRETAAPEVAPTDDSAPRAVAGNRQLPLARILAIARERVPGEVLEVDLDEDDGEIEYELEILTGDGRVVEMKLDARTGAIIEMDWD